MTPPRARSSRHALALVFLTVFIDLLGFGMVIPLLPVYSRAYGSDELTLGLLFSCFSAMQFVSAPVWGRLSDRAGRRPALVGGLLGTSASYVVFAFADSMGWLFASRLLAGLFGGNVGVAHAYIADVTTPENRAKGMGLIGAAFGLGFTFGPLLGGELTALSPHAPGLAAAGLSLAAASLAFLRLPEVARQREGGARPPRLELARRAMGEGRIGVLLGLNLLAIGAFSAFESMFTRYGLALFPAIFRVPQAVELASVEEVLRAAPVAGRYTAAIGVLAAVVQGGLIRRLVPRFGEVNLIVAGPLLTAAAFLVVGLAPAWGFVVAGCVLLPFGLGVTGPSLSALLSRAAPAAEQGAYLGLNQSVASLGRVLAPPCAGAIFAGLGPRAPFFAGGALLAAAAWIAARYRARHGGSFRQPITSPAAAAGSSGR